MVHVGGTVSEPNHSNCQFSVPHIATCVVRFGDRTSYNIF